MKNDIPNIHQYNFLVKACMYDKDDLFSDRPDKRFASSTNKESLYI